MVAVTAAQIGALCHAALIKEVDATPKPGLVDRANNGAHTDMDHAMFCRSADALQGYYVQVAQYGIDTAALSPQEALAGMRPLGIAAEQHMFAATGGINTHKGAIFSLGLLAAAAGRLQSLGQPLLPVRLCATAAAYVQGITRRELGRSDPATKGERAYLQHGAKGVRGEAEAGFPGALHHGLPAFRQALGRGVSENDALLYALLHILAHTLDTNILTRCGADAAAHTSAQARALLAQTSLPQALSSQALPSQALPQQALPVGSPAWREALAAMDAECIAKNSSPGGCADLLAAAWLLYALGEGYVYNGM